MSSPFSLLFNTTPKSSQPHKPNRKTKPRPHHKNPQRGMGVERLERLRLQELQKNTQHHHLDLHNYAFNLNKDPLPVPVPEQVQCYPVQYGLPVNMFGMNVNGKCGGGLLGWDQNNVGFKSLENGGFGLNDRGAGSGQVSQHDHVSNVKELSSVPNVFVSNMHHHQYSSYCDLCFKKKMLTMNEDQNLGHKQRKSYFSPQISPADRPDFLGLNLDNNINLNTNKTTGSFNTSRPARNASHTNHNTTKSKDVVAVHRKGNTCRGGGSALMEYEFFPRSKTSEINYGSITSTATKEWEFQGSSETKVAVGSSVGGGEASSCVTMCDYSTQHSSNSIDLSLRLSC